MIGITHTESLGLEMKGVDDIPSIERRKLIID